MEINHLGDPCVVDFGTIFVNTKYTKSFEVLNTTSIKQIFTVYKYHDEPKLDTGFKIVPLVSPVIKPGGSFRFQIEFYAKYVYRACSDTFLIKHQYGIQDALFTKAIVRGPQCSFSCKELQMYCPVKKKSTNATFRIHNNGGCNIKFQFILDASHPRLSLQPSHGTIQPSTSLQVTITFTPIKHKQYFKKILCHIENHQPIALDVHAIGMKTDQITNLLVAKKYNCQELMNTDKFEELVSVDKINIDFGHCLPICQKHDVFTVTNNRDTNMLLIWNQDVLGANFRVQPPQMILERTCSTDFNVLFKPVLRDMLYSATLEGQLFVDEQLQPFTLDINLKGHSFDEVSCGWAAQYKVKPCSLILAPSLPDSVLSTHSTLTIHRYGHLPMAFKFHPPEKSTFSVTPLQGVIHGPFQIVFVEFRPKHCHEATYIEKWLLSFNSNEDVNQCIIELAASVETPQLLINNGRDVQFPKVHPGSMCELPVDVFNPTRLFFQYNVQILRGESVLTLEGKGEVWPQEHRKVPWWFHPQGVGALEALVSYTPTLEVDVKASSTTVLVKAVSEKTELKVVPVSLRFDQVLQGCQQARGFELINVGDSYINSELQWWPEDNCNTSDIEINFKPSTFSLKPGDKVIINVFILPLQKGPMKFAIGYCCNEVNLILIQAAVDSVFPTLRVVDLQHSTTNPLFTKLDFWKIMQIDKLNFILDDMKKETTPVVKMNFPSNICTSGGFTLKLLVENYAKIGVKFSICQRVNCDCKPIKTPVSFSRCTWTDNCPHKNQLEITPMSGFIEAQSNTILCLDVHYKTTGVVDLIFCLKLTPEDYEEITKCIELHFSRTSIPEGTSHIDTVEPKKNGKFLFELKPVFIGDCYPFIQALTLYNPTKFPANVTIDSTKLQGTPFKFIGEMATIDPLTVHPLLFTFLPYESKMYEVETTISINNEQKSLILRGTGMSSRASDFCSNIKEQIITGNEKLCIINPPPVYLSTSHIYIGLLKPTCSQRHVIFLNNNTNEIISFKWNITKVFEVVELRVHPHKGAIDPGGMVECRLISNFKGCPCYLTCTLTCVVASFTKYLKTLKSLHDYEKRVKKAEECFVITECGEKNIEILRPTEDWPLKGFLTVSVTMRVNHDECKLANDYLPFTPSSFQINPLWESNINVSHEQRLQIINVLEEVLWEALNELHTSFKEKNNETLLRYIQMKNIKEELDVPVPGQVMQSVLEDVLFTEWLSVFNLTSRNGTEQLQRSIRNSLRLATEAIYEDSTLNNMSTLSSLILPGLLTSNLYPCSDDKKHNEDKLLFL